MIMKPGRVIVLDGASRSGKSSLARALQRVLQEPYWNVSQDHFWEMLPPEGTAQRGMLTAEGCLSGMHHAIAALAGTGNNVILDTGLLEKAWREELEEALRPYSVLFVAVYCPLPELERRERERGDRPEGYTRLQFERIHRHGAYDLTVDTSVRTPEECARVIADTIRPPH